jgi:hypothetical protein
LLQPPTGGADWVIEARVDSRGRVSDYRIISNADGLTDLSPQIKGSLIFTTFQPATYMGSSDIRNSDIDIPKRFVSQALSGGKRSRTDSVSGVLSK